MPSLATIRSGKTSYLPLISPTIICVGGTSGIGESIAKRYARISTDPEIHLVGRNENEAKRIIQELKVENASGQYKFHSCDLTLFSNIKQLITSLRSSLRQDQSIDYLILSAGILTMSGRTETIEGHDRKMMLHYYSRMALIDGLRDKLSKRSRVMSVLDGTRGDPDKLFWNDLDLKSNYSIRNAATHCITMNDISAMNLGGSQKSASESNISYFHVLPGLVSTPLGNQLSWPIRTFLVPLARLVATTPSNCAEYLLHAFLSEDIESYRVGDAFFCDNKGDAVGQGSKKMASREEMDKVWKHTLDMIAGR